MTTQYTQAAYASAMETAAELLGIVEHSAATA
jgi:hypothetical protein